MNKQTFLISSILVLALCGAACVAKNVVVRVPQKDGAKVKSEGVFYALPRTVINVEVPVNKTTKKEGKYNKFAKCLFRTDELEGIIDKSEIAFDLGTPVLTPSSEPDPNEIFLVKIKGHYFEDKKMSFDWTENSVLTKASMDTTNRLVDMVTQTVQTAATLAVKAGITGFEGSQKSDFETKCSEQLKLQKDDQELQDALKAYDQYLIWLAARTRVVTGATSPGIPVGDSLQQMLKEIDGQIKLYKELFFGTATKEVWNAHFAVTPDKNDWDKPFQLFEFTSEKGVCLSPDLQSPCAAQPNDSKVSFLDAGVPKKFQGVQACPCKGEMVALKLQRDDQQLATQISKNAENPDGERGFYYRVPAFSTANILKGTKPILRNKLVIAQFGPTFSLPSSTGGRKTSYDIELYATGALKNFKLGSEGLLTSATVKDLGSAAGTVLDARAQAAQAAAASDFNQVKRMRELLEECQKIKNAQVGLSLPVNLPAYCPQ